MTKQDSGNVISVQFGGKPKTTPVEPEAKGAGSGDEQANEAPAPAEEPAKATLTKRVEKTTGSKVVTFPGAAAKDEPVEDYEASDEDRRKLEAFRALIDEGMVAVTFDTRPASVKIPANFKGGPQLILNFSHRFNIPDFAFDERGVRASLSFDSGDFFCQLPWSAVYIMQSKVNGRLFVSPDSFPVEVKPMLPKLMKTLMKQLDPEDL